MNWRNIPPIQILLDTLLSEDKMKNQKILICQIHGFVQERAKDRVRPCPHANEKHNNRGGKKMPIDTEKKEKIKQLFRNFLLNRIKTVHKLKIDNLDINPFLIRILSHEMDLRNSEAIVRWLVNQRIERGAVTSELRGNQHLDHAT